MSEPDGFDELARLVALIDETLLAHDQRLRELHHTYAHLDANARHLIADVVVDALLSDERLVAYATRFAHWTKFNQLVAESSLNDAAAEAIRARTPPAISAAIAVAASAGARADRAEEERDRLRDDVEEYDQLLLRLRDLLTGTANALKGEPPENVIHDWSDLPVVAGRIVSERDHLLKASPSDSMTPERNDE